jgi:hypothetical protein
MLDCRLQDSNRLQQINISARNIKLLSSNIQLPYAANTTAACNTFKYFCLQYTTISHPPQHLILETKDKNDAEISVKYSNPLQFIRWHNFLARFISSFAAEIHSVVVVDLHHFDAIRMRIRIRLITLNADQYSDFYLMRIRLSTLMRIRIQFLMVAQTLEKVLK